MSMTRKLSKNPTARISYFDIMQMLPPRLKLGKIKEVIRDL